MKTQKSLILSASIAVLLLSAPASAEFGSNLTDEQRTQIQDKLENMTPEQKAAAREKVQQRVQNMTPEQKAAARARIKERVKNMSPEQKAALRERIKARRGG